LGGTFQLFELIEFANGRHSQPDLELLILVYWAFPGTWNLELLNSSDSARSMIGIVTAPACWTGTAK
jgi:hypothetical protein